LSVWKTDEFRRATDYYFLIISYVWMTGQAGSSARSVFDVANLEIKRPALRRAFIVIDAAI